MKTTNKRSTFFAFAVTAMMLAASMVMGCKQPSVTVTAYPVSFSAVGGTVTASVDGKEIKNGELIGVGKEVTFTAHPQSGMQVSRWTGIDKSEGKVTITLTVKAGVSVTAECTAIMHTVTFAQPEHGKLTASIDGKDFTGGAVAEGKTVLFKAEPDKGYAVKQWTGAGKEGCTDKTVALTVEKESTVSVEFIDEESLVEKYTVSFTGTLEKGTLSAKVDGEAFTGGTVQKGKTVVFTATPADGYRVKKWTGTDNPASTDKTAVLTVKENATVSVEFEAVGQPFNITFDTPQNGTLTASLDGAPFTGGEVEKDKIIVFTAEPAPTYRVRKWTGLENADTKTILTLTVTKAVHVSVEFINVPEYTITFNQPANGTLKATLDGVQFNSGDKAGEGQHIVFTAIPETGYRLLKWENVNTDLNHGYIKVHTVKADKTVSVTFETDDILTIRKDSSGEHYVESCKKTAEGVIEVPDYVKSIGFEAFEDCVKVTEVKLPAGLTQIESSAFEDCTGLTSITLPAGLTEIGSSAFLYCTGLTIISLPAGVTKIEYSAFKGCTGLTSITLPAGVTKIEYEVFSGCTGLTSITVPAGVTKIEHGTFLDCTGLTSITLPAGVTEIDGSAFYSCTGLKDITIEAMNITGIDSSAFDYIHAEARFKVKSGGNVKQKLIDCGVDASKIEEI